ncbi:hypothetical protein BDZ89DRAFT_390548 [Hymenopellis radicata]|nr:hypothetical protein BDZ89DRAFT_390548 [Hymenopellis radicata]
MDPSTIDVSSMAFDNSLGALLIGGLLAMALWGITCIQTYHFFNNNTRDRPAFKLMIAGMFVLDTFHAAICCHILYYYMVSNYLNVLAILAPVWSVIVLVTITSISDFIIRSLFARRVYRLSNGNVPVTLLIAALSVGDLVCGLVITGKALRRSSSWTSYRRRCTSTSHLEPRVT